MRSEERKMEMVLEGEIKDMTQQNQYFHVLAVDDSLIHRKLIEKLLKTSSYKVTCVESGSKALEYLGLPANIENSSSSSSSSSSPSLTTQRSEEVKVNLIITDYCMPGMSGYDLLRRVKKSSWKDVPVVVMSSENVPSRIHRCLEGGAEEFILKPVQLSDMKTLQPHLLKSLKSSRISIVLTAAAISTTLKIHGCLEGGAEEFILKPVQLSDMKKLQPHLLKSLKSSRISNGTDGSSNMNDPKNCNSSNTNSSSNKKRKAVSQPGERRSKFRG